MADLDPPRRTVDLEDHRTQDSSYDDHFSDASEGQQSDESPATPVPTTRVERVDSQPSHGEVPGTQAYQARTQDAVPDEIEVVHEGSTSRRNSQHISTEHSPSRSSPIPKTVVEKVDPEVPSYGDVPGTASHETRKADAQPDEVVRAPDVTRADLEGDNEDDFGDDFDDFEAGSLEDDFAAFDEVPQQSVAPIENASVPPLVDFDGLNTVEEIVTACQPYLDEIFSDLIVKDNSSTDQLSDVNGSLLTERSQSLWSQLIAPPPLAPPNWVKSRIRRLFLVSLGVPVDLDEILPASKQKKLILPSMDLEGADSSSREIRPNGTISRLKQDNNSSTSLNSATSKSERRRKGPPPPPELDVNSIRLLCSTTDVALENFADEELRHHVIHLEELKQRASEVLEYWLVRKDTAIGEKDAFEEVIENLVKHAKKIRK